MTPCTTKYQKLVNHCFQTLSTWCSEPLVCSDICHEIPPGRTQQFLHGIACGLLMDTAMSLFMRQSRCNKERATGERSGNRQLVANMSMCNLGFLFTSLHLLQLALPGTATLAWACSSLRGDQVQRRHSKTRCCSTSSADLLLRCTVRCSSLRHVCYQTSSVHEAASKAQCSQQSPASSTNRSCCICCVSSASSSCPGPSCVSCRDKHKNILLFNAWQAGAPCVLGSQVPSSTAGTETVETSARLCAHTQLR